MDEKQFWKIIKRARSEADGDVEAIADGVHEQLVELPAGEIESFNDILGLKFSAACTWGLWGAAYLMNGGCSDDGFAYFRGWLLAQGEKVFEAALADPDSLARIADPDDDENECEDLLYVAARVHEEVTGKALSLPADDGQPTGERWDFDDAKATRQHLPRLARKYAE